MPCLCLLVRLSCYIDPRLLVSALLCCTMTGYLLAPVYAWLSVSLTPATVNAACPPSPFVCLSLLDFLFPALFLWLLSGGLCIRYNLGTDFLWFMDSSQTAICSDGTIQLENLCKEPPANT